MQLFVNNMLQDKRLMNSAEVRSEPGLSGAAKVMILSVLHNAVIQNACVQPDERFANSYGSVVVGVISATTLEDGSDK